MARPNGDFTRGPILVAQSAFTAGCFGCLGVAASSFALFVLVFVVFQPQFAALIKTVSFPASPIVVNIQPAPSVKEQVAQATLIEIFVTAENRPEAARLSEITIPIQQPLYVCVRGPQGRPVQFSVRIVLPDGEIVPFGDFQTDGEGGSLCLGAVSQLPEVQGTVRFEAVVGATVVGSAMLTIVSQ